MWTGHNVNVCGKLGLNPKLPHHALPNWIRDLCYQWFPYKVNTHRAPEFSFKFRKDLVATFSGDDVITTRPREKILSRS